MKERGKINLFYEVISLKDTIFISHATPDDNEFAAWLATKLELCGYKVWIDLKSLDPSDDFWLKIDNAIRNESVKFIFVMSKASVDTSRTGVQKELAVADKMRKQDNNFIIPVRIDNVSYDNLLIEVLRLNAIDFSDNWAAGLKKLIEFLNKENIMKAKTKTTSEEILSRWYQIKSSINSQITDKEDVYYSNLFSIEMPEYLYIYPAVQVENVLKVKYIPYKKIRKVVLTFACNKCITEWCGTNIDFYRIKTIDAMAEQNENVEILDQIINRISRNIVNLLNWNISELFFSKGLRRFKGNDQKRSRRVYYFPKNTKSKRAISGREKNLSGKYKEKNWHYGISAYCTQFPTFGVIIRGHLIFTDSQDRELSDSSQITARRSKGKRFYNKEWKELLQTAMYYISNGSDYIYYTNCCELNAMYLSQQPEKFVSKLGYLEPERIVGEVEDTDE